MAIAPEAYARNARLALLLVALSMVQGAIAQASSSGLPGLDQRCADLAERGPTGEVSGDRSMPWRPRPCARVAVNPPTLTWPADHPGPWRVELMLEGDSAVRAMGPSARNWWHLAAPLPAGAHRWRAVPQGVPSDAVPWRPFTVPGAAPTWLVPSVDELWRRSVEGKRPRAFAQGEALQQLKSALDGNRRDGWKALVLRARADLARPLADNPDATPRDLPDRHAQGEIDGRNRSNAGRELERAMLSAALWRLDGDANQRDDARRRTLAMLAWSPRGATGIDHHLITGHQALGLALLRDWLHETWTPAELQALTAHIGQRLDDLVHRFGMDATRRRLDLMPFHSHAWVTMGQVAAAATLMAGDLPQAQAWVRDTVPAWLAMLSPWGGDDGGLGNGIAYGVWDIQMTAWAKDVLRMTTGVDAWASGWARHVPHYLRHFAPAGQRAVAFGDAAERMDVAVEIGALAQLLAQRRPDVETRAYAAATGPGPSRRTGLLWALAPVADPLSQAPPMPLADALLASDVGQVAWHVTEVGVPRHSVYFRASAYGSFNHSHADQNAFVVFASGEPLLIDSGYYDYRGTPHLRDWYMHTRAHNAVTFDDGHGQAVGPRRTARIVQYERSDGLDLVVGEAAPAYGVGMQMARRALVFVRPGLLLAWDRLAATTPRRWELNLHAARPFEPLSGGAWRALTREGSASACVHVVGAEPGDWTFRQTEGFDAAPRPLSGVGIALLPQTHGRWQAPAPSASASVLMVIRLDCDQPAPGVGVLPDGDGWRVEVGGRSLTLRERGGMVELASRPQ
ncbi:MAG: heparinase II/III family protein [Aquabacterium sp.]